MRMKLIWLPCLVFFFGVLCTSCGSDNNEPTDEPGTGDAGGTGDTEVKGDYIASTKVKTVVLKSEWKWYSADIPVCYEDFNRKYSLFLDAGKLCVLPFVREYGKWSPRSSSYGYESFYLIMEDIGKVKSLSEVTKKLELVDNIICPFPNAQPKHGYAVTFKTENDELKYLRLFVIDYTLTDDGAIATFTVQYQLY